MTVLKINVINAENVTKEVDMEQNETNTIKHAERHHRGFGKCHNLQSPQNGRKHLHQHENRHNGLCRHQQADRQNDFYEFNSEELQSRKATLEKELQWLNARIIELGDNNENSNTIN
jgi:hypothetical protein